MTTSLEHWYRNMTLPTWGNKMEQFAMPSVGLLSALLPGKAANLNIMFTDGVRTALADQANRRIVVDRCAFSPDSSQRLNPKASASLAISFVLGAILHEGGHFAYSPATIPEFFNPGVATNSITCGIANIVEDLYIEHRIVTENESIAWMIFAVWEYLFGEDRRKNKWDGVTVTNDTLGNIVDQMAQWKDQNRVFNFRSDFEATLYEMMYSVRGMQNLQDRRNLIEAIIKFLKQSVKEQKQEEQGKQGQKSKSSGQESKSSGSNSGKSDGGEKQEEEADADESEDSEEEVEDENAEEESDDAADFEDDDEGELDKDESGDDEVDSEDDLSYLDIVEVIRGQFTPDGELVTKPIDLPYWLENPATAEIDGMKISSLESHDDVAVAVVIPESLRGGKLFYDAKWRKFGTIAKQRGAVRFVTGNANTSGKRITHPQNISEGRIFSTGRLDATSGSIHKAPLQVVILLDCSGSMGNNDKFSKTMHAAFGASVGMADAGIRHAIYGYTTGNLGNVQSVMMYAIKSMSESAAVGQERLAYMENFEDKVNMDYTPDVEALQFASTKFVNDGSDRVIIVISDGMPYCVRYMGTEKAVEKVKKIRATGVKVFGLSIDSSADSSVRAIYGKDALCDSDPNAINKFLGQFI